MFQLPHMEYVTVDRLEGYRCDFIFIFTCIFPVFYAGVLALIHSAAVLQGKRVLYETTRYSTVLGESLVSIQSITLYYELEKFGNKPFNS